MGGGGGLGAYYDIHHEEQINSYYRSAQYIENEGL